MKFTDLSREWGRGGGDGGVACLDTRLRQRPNECATQQWQQWHVACCTLLPCGNKKSGKRIVVNQRWSRSRSRSRSSSKSCAVAKHPHTHTRRHSHTAIATLPPCSPSAILPFSPSPFSHLAPRAIKTVAYEKCAGQWRRRLNLTYTHTRILIHTHAHRHIRILIHTLPNTLNYTHTHTQQKRLLDLSLLCTFYPCNFFRSLSLSLSHSLCLCLYEKTMLFILQNCS